MGPAVSKSVGAFSLAAITLAAAACSREDSIETSQDPRTSTNTQQAGDISLASESLVAVEDKDRPMSYEEYQEAWKSYLSGVSQDVKDEAATLLRSFPDYVLADPALKEKFAKSGYGDCEVTGPSGKPYEVHYQYTSVSLSGDFDIEPSVNVALYIIEKGGRYSLASYGGTQAETMLKRFATCEHHVARGGIKDTM